MTLIVMGALSVIADWLYGLPDAALFVLFSGATVLAFFGLWLVVRRRPSLHPVRDDADFGVRAQGTLFSVCSLVLAFSLVQAETNARHVESVVAAEASEINRLDRALDRMNDPASESARALLRAYARSVVADEWPAMTRGGASPRTRAAFTALYDGALSLPPNEASSSGEIMKSMDAIADRREERIDLATVGLPPVFWAVIAFGMAIFVAASSTLATTGFRRMIVACQAAVLGALLAVVFINDQPFKGQTSVSPHPFVKALDAMTARLR
jgi:hypothetical protein